MRKPTPLLLLLLVACDGGQRVGDDVGGATPGRLGGACSATQACNAGLDCYEGACRWYHESPAQAAAEGGPCCVGTDCPDGECFRGLECLGGICGGEPVEGVTLTISAGTEPTYDWSPEALASVVLVVDGAQPDVRIWGLRSQAGVTLPVDHLATDGEVLASMPLEAGRTYRLVVSSLDGATFYQDFTP